MAIANDGTYPGYHQLLFLTDVNGSFTPWPLISIRYLCNSVIAGDIDGDGDVDLVYGQDDSKVTVYKNNGSGGFPDSTGYEMPFTPSGFFVADFDLDGHDDLAVANKWDGYFAVMFNRGDGVFDRTGYFRLGDYGKSITGADLDGDGDIDLAAPTCTDHADSLRIFWNQKELIPAGIGDEPQKPLPNLFALRQNYPNPFNPSTTIEYSLSRAAEVTITIGNVLGQTVCTLEQEDQPAGQHRVIWNGKDAAGRTVASGVYFYRLKAGDFVRAKKMILLK